ncbi:MraY family glycosyltransferase [Chitinasiproducens palmae]|uniref:UDP-N-acetylmuramyl pentapeptide phosphotransferase/UDP-N-acetylglucosamine-1-phosphate transferase n=1 Tax=Chitinasiproducens palmae TaxID=1770053 RepID=A0A1H2PNP9_9BURK|nr:glycosyltransferase family 4 protein [Chitinasiproducens palmae]SDV47818.1 UDP-N-acetylmuramyl pentapeptide phosphotransferase/UDP-N-acetylglucosamine-1-phosphate transferase [Chitinasiproducens palmae]
MIAGGASAASWPLLSAGLAAMAVAAVILAILLWTGWAWRLAVDQPNHRSMHQRPTPRSGGWGVTPAAALSIVLLAPALHYVAWLMLVLAAVSFIDDRRGLSARYRFGCQLLAAGALLAGSPGGVAGLPWPWLSAPVLVVAVVWTTNLYNFMDGADGLAGGMAVSGFGALALAALPTEPALACACAALAGAALGFLFFNLPPARLFLGDAGSIPLGFAVAALSLIGWRLGCWPWWVPLTGFAPFLLDATTTLLRRAARREKVWEAHREHFYQRMMLMTGDRRRVLFQWYALMLAGNAVAWLACRVAATADAPAGHGRHALASFAMCALWFVVLVWLGRRVDRRWQVHSSVSAQESAGSAGKQ